MTPYAGITSAAAADAAAEVLDRAADIFTVRGGGQGRWVSGGKVCVNGAIAMAAGLIDEDHQCIGWLPRCGHGDITPRIPSARYFTDWCVSTYGFHSWIVNDYKPKRDVDLTDGLRLAAKDLRNGRWQP